MTIVAKTKIFYQSAALAVIVSALAVLTAGCQTSRIWLEPALPGQSARSGAEIVANVRAENYGYYLFGFIPLWSGDTNRPNAELYVTWQDKVNENGLAELLDTARRRSGGTRVEEVEFQKNSSGWWSAFLLWRKVIQGHGVIVKAPTKQ